MGAPERRHGAVRILCGESEPGSSAHTTQAGSVGWREMLSARRNSEARAFGLCDYLQEPRQCEEVTEDGEPNAIPVELGVGSALPAWVSRSARRRARYAAPIAASPALAQVPRGHAFECAPAVAAVRGLRRVAFVRIIPGL